MRALALLLFLCLTARAADRPNILWITSEDNASSWLGCYGNPQAQTPRLDALAASGLRFSAAFSNAPVCAVARSTILNGAYAVTQGTQHMRSRYPIPSSYIPYVTLLRQTGYYCTNNSKTDYNFRGKDNALWDECSGKAHYLNRRHDQPFFAIFNLTVSHESSLFPATITANRKRGIIPESPRIAPADVILPPYLPDLPEIRSDAAIYHDTITALDRQVGGLLDKLKADGLAEDTIVFYYSDHAGILPRGKRYLEDSGTRVPLLIHFPQKWRHLSPFAAGSVIDEPVSFVDFAPTLLSIAGCGEIPSSMEGRPFLGPKRRDPEKEAVVFLFADRFDQRPGMRRGITDGRWKYIRCFTTHQPGAPYSTYQFGQAGWSAWQKAWRDGKLSPEFRALWETPQPVERLYDTQSDPHEVKNLAGDPEQEDRLAAMRSRLMTEMIRRRDTGLVPEGLFEPLAGDAPVATYVNENKDKVKAWAEMAFLAGKPDPEQIDQLAKSASSEDPVIRHWAAMGLLHLEPTTDRRVPAALSLLTKDSQAAVRIVGHAAVARHGDRKLAVDGLVAELANAKSTALIMSALQTLESLGALDAVPAEWINSHSGKNADEYTQRWVEDLRKLRGDRGRKKR